MMRAGLPARGKWREGCGMTLTDKSVSIRIGIAIDKIGKRGSSV